MIKRKVFEALRAHLEEKEIALIVGPRQAGKTTLMLMLKKELDERGEATLFLSLDNEMERPLFESQQKLLSKIELEMGRKNGFVFIDEIQRKEDAGVFLKGIYDMNLPYKLIVSGSGSVELKEKVHESLVGRKRIFEVATVSFEEFVDFKLDYKYTGKIKEWFGLHAVWGRELLDEYMNFGGYPRVMLAESSEEKRIIMADIYQSYLEKDIAFLLNIRKTEGLTHLVRVLAEQAGNLIKVSELANTLGLSAQTVNDYLWYLEKTFIIRRVTPFFKNVRKEITKASTVYFVDLGLRNFALGEWGTVAQGGWRGFLFENFVYNTLREGLKDTAATAHFWRTQDKAEVDLVVDVGVETIPVEVKHQVLRRPQTTRSLQSFLKKYKPRRGYVVHMGERLERKIGESRIVFVPYYETVNLAEELRESWRDW